MLAITILATNYTAVKGSTETAQPAVVPEAESAEIDAGTNQTSNNKTQVSFLIIQHASAGSIMPLDNGTYSLTLDNVSKSIAFSDRPQRIVGILDNQGFIDTWTAGVNSFAVDPPNAALVVIDSNTTEEDIAVLELLNVTTANADLNGFQYNVKALNATSLDIPSQFGETTLVIDPSIHPYRVADTKIVSSDMALTSP